MSIALNGNTGKIILNGTTYYAGGVSGGGGSTLITKSITQNGTYSAQDDNADGYSEVRVNVGVPNYELISTFIEENTYEHFVSQYEANGVYAVPLNETQSLSGYVSYDSSTNKIIVQKDFLATLVGRVFALGSANSWHCGCCWLNDARLLGYCYTASSEHFAGEQFSLMLHAGDEIKLSSTNIVEPTVRRWTEPGYPQQQLKIYKGLPATVAQREEILNYIYYDYDSSGWLFGSVEPPE